MTPFEIFLVATPGLETILADEAKAAGFAVTGQAPGGVMIRGDWRDVWRANLQLRGTGAVLARLGSFRASHLSELDKRARKFPWTGALRNDVHVRVSASCKASRIYHSGAVKQRIENALAEAGIPLGDAAGLEVMARIEKDVCTISVDTSGLLLHKRGHKEAMAKAPLRETMASLFLRQCNYAGTEPVLDPMCGSGTFILEAAEMALGLQPGRDRAFAFEKLQSFDPAAWANLRLPPPRVDLPFRFFGFDRNAGAIAASRANAERAGVASLTRFVTQPVSALARPEGPPGLVIVNPPYGKRIGDINKLSALYATLGRVLRQGFAGWRIGIVTNDKQLAQATGLVFVKPAPPVLHGGLRVQLYRTEALPG